MHRAHLFPSIQSKAAASATIESLECRIHTPDMYIDAIALSFFQGDTGYPNFVSTTAVVMFSSLIYFDEMFLFFPRKSYNFIYW